LSKVGEHFSGFSMKSLTKCFVLASFLALPARTAGQALPANTLAQGEAAIAAINLGDSIAAIRFVTARFSARALEQRSAPEVAALLMDLYRQSGGVGMKSAERLGSGIAVTLWARNADRGVLLYVVSDRPDTTRIGRLDALRFFHPAATVRELPAFRNDGREFFAGLRAELGRLTATGEFSGTVVITRSDSVVFEEGYGRAVQPAGELNGAATRFHLASVGKMFTATAIGQLIEAGRLSLDDSIGTLLPQFKWAARSRAVTVRHLLSHASGLGQSERAGDPIDSTFAATPPAFGPGTRFSYSNDGYELLGLIIERISGQSYQDYVRDHVFRVAGMGETDAYPADQPLAHRAIGYGHRDKDYFGSQPLVPNIDKVKGRGTAAGGSYGTARDLTRFAGALLSGRLVGPAVLDTLLVPRWPLPGPFPDERYGYGFETHVVNGVTVVGHAGGGEGWGICSRLDALLTGGYRVAVLTNVDPPLCMDVSRAIVRALTRREEASGKK
jgi:CubicO group peptidase (beta-lactamase class C family)